MIIPGQSLVADVAKQAGCSTDDAIKVIQLIANHSKVSHVQGMRSVRDTLLMILGMER